MRLVQKAFLAVAFAITGCTLAACGGDSGRRSYSFGNTNGMPPTVVIPAPTGHVRRDRELAAVGIANGDMTSKRLVGRVPHSLTASESWTTLDGKPLGVELVYALRRPLAIDADLPYIETPPDAPAHGDCVQPYAPGWLHLRASRVTVVTVSVDLRRRRVADISTNATRGVVSPVAGKPYPSCSEDGSGP